MLFFLFGLRINSMAQEIEEDVKERFVAKNKGVEFQACFQFLIYSYVQGSMQVLSLSLFSFFLGIAAH